MALGLKKRETEEPKQLEELGDDEIRSRIRVARVEFDALVNSKPDSSRRREAAEKIKRQAEIIKTGRHELEARADMADARRAVAKDPDLREARRLEREHEKVVEEREPLRSVITFVAKREHRVIGDAVLALDPLCDDDGRPSEAGLELVGLVQNIRSYGFGTTAEPPTDQDLQRYEFLVGVACGQPDIFERKRAEAAAREEAREMAKSIVKLPQGESLVAAVMADAHVFDLLREKLRENMTVIDERGQERKVSAVERILEPEHVAVLFLLMNVIGENGGHEVRLTQHGAIREGAADGRLPFVDVKLLGQLRRNGFIAVRREGVDYIVRPGERVREIAERWGISLPTP
jgi:hypothetical protein